MDKKSEIQAIGCLSVILLCSCVVRQPPTTRADIPIPSSAQAMAVPPRPPPRPHPKVHTNIVLSWKPVMIQVEGSLVVDRSWVVTIFSTTGLTHSWKIITNAVLPPVTLLINTNEPRRFYTAGFSNLSTRETGLLK